MEPNTKTQTETPAIDAATTETAALAAAPSLDDQRAYIAYHRHGVHSVIQLRTPAAVTERFLQVWRARQGVVHAHAAASASAPAAGSRAPRAPRIPMHLAPAPGSPLLALDPIANPKAQVPVTLAPLDDQGQPSRYHAQRFLDTLGVVKSSYELRPGPTASVRSFYGKAHVAITPSHIVLVSYGIPILALEAVPATTHGATSTAAVDLPYPPLLLVHPLALSATTTRHLREFLSQRGLTATASLARPRLLKELGAS